MLQCQHCDYTSTRYDHLKVFSRKHTGERLQCRLSGYTTTHSAALKAHSRKHSGEMLQYHYVIIVIIQQLTLVT